MSVEQKQANWCRLTGKVVRVFHAKPNTNQATIFTIETSVFNHGNGKVGRTFISCKAWAETQPQTEGLHEGDTVTVQGPLQSGSYINKKGDKVYKTEVVTWTVERAARDNFTGAEVPTNQAPPQYQAPPAQYANVEVPTYTNDDIPF